MISRRNYGLTAFLLTGVAISATLFYRISSANSFLKGYCSFWYPLFWFGLTLIVLYLPRPHLPARLRSGELFVGLALSCAAVFIFVQFLAGFLLKKIAASPYDLSPKGILINFRDLLPPIVGFELLRAYTIGAACRGSRYPHLWIILEALILGTMQLPFAKFAALQTSESLFIFLAKDLLPSLVQSGFLSILVYCGGVFPAILYRSVISIFLHIFPFLPSLPWIGDSVLGIAFPVFASLFIWEQYGYVTHRKIRGKPESLPQTAITLILCITFGWFVVGVFPVYPSVILTGSMEPDIKPGDVVLIEKIKTEQEIYSLSESDIINFKRGNIVITHRIIQILCDENGNLSFRTKGDNNDTEDPEVVYPNDIKGIVDHTVPKIGLPVLWLRGQRSIPEGVTDNETP